MTRDKRGIYIIGKFSLLIRCPPNNSCPFKFMPRVSVKDYTDLEIANGDDHFIVPIIVPDLASIAQYCTCNSDTENPL